MAEAVRWGKAVARLYDAEKNTRLTQSAQRRAEKTDLSTARRLRRAGASVGMTNRLWHWWCVCRAYGAGKEEVVAWAEENLTPEGVSYRRGAGDG